MTRAPAAAPRFVGRAALGFGVVTLISALTAFSSAFFARQQGAARTRTLQTYADDLAHASRAQLSAERLVALVRGYFLAPEPDLLDRIRDIEGDLQNALASLDHAGLSSGERDQLFHARRAAAVYRRSFYDIVTTASPPQIVAGASTFRERLLPVREEVGDRLQAVADHKRKLLGDARAAAAATASRTFDLMAVFGVLGISLSGLLAWAFIHRVGGIYRREQESAARATRESSAKEELLGVVAHDLRNPLQAIAVKATVLRDRSDDYRTQKQAEGIVNLAMRMNAFIERLLEAASIQAGRLAVSWKKCLASEVLSATMETFTAIAAQKAVSLEQGTAPEGLAFWGDAERIVQVLSNLVGNAIKFTPAGGSVKIRAVESGFHARFEVRDTGPGIASSTLPHVFERFWKADAGGQRGAGLGLYIAKGIVESHRGRIWVESRIGAGSAFIFELPIAQADRTEPNVEPSVSALQPAAEPTHRS